MIIDTKIFNSETIIGDKYSFGDFVCEMKNRAVKYGKNCNDSADEILPIFHLVRVAGNFLSQLVLLCQFSSQKDTVDTIKAIHELGQSHYHPDYAAAIFVSSLIPVTPEILAKIENGDLPIPELRQTQAIREDVLSLVCASSDGDVEISRFEFRDGFFKFIEDEPAVMEVDPLVLPIVYRGCNGKVVQ